MNAFVNNISFSTLRYVLGGITFVGGTGIYFVKRTEGNNIYKTKIIVDAIDLARDHVDLRTLLGEPIKGGKINFADEKNFVNEDNAHLEIPIHGKIHTAIMLVDAVKNSDMWELDNVNIQFRGKESIIAQINLFKKT